MKTTSTSDEQNQKPGVIFAFYPTRSRVWVRQSHQPSELMFGLRNAERTSRKAPLPKSTFTRRKVWRKTLKFLGFLCFLSGCMYQSTEFLRYFLMYPTTVEVNVRNSRSLGFPAVTVCNNNRVNFRKWCEVEPEVCEPFANETYQSYRRRSKSTYDAKTKEERIALAPTMDEFVLHAEFDERDMTQTMAQFYDFEYSNCFTFNALWGKNSPKIRNATLFDPVSGKSSEFIIAVNMDLKNYSPLVSSINARMAIHSEDTVPNIRYDGVSLEPGKFFAFGVQKLSAHLLKAPYQTNCRNYTNEVEVRTGGKMSQENCLTECYKAENVKRCNCTYLRIALLYDAERCSSAEQKKCLDDTIQHVSAACYKECRMACQKVSYRNIAVNSEPLRKYASIYDRMNVTKHFASYDEMAENMAVIKIYYGSTETTSLTHHPKYANVEVFSLLGGYSGLWLGFSILTAYTYLLNVVRNYRKVSNHGKRINKQKSPESASSTESAE